MAGRLSSFAAIIAFAAAFPAARADDSAGPGCPKLVRRVDQPVLRITTEPATRYPVGQQSMLGEGWVRLRHTVAPGGDVTNIKLLDFVGAPIFAYQASGALAQAKFAPVTISGRAVPFNAEFMFTYRMEGKNRAGVHARVSSDYDAAAAARTYGQYERSLDILQKTNLLTLNLYEYTLTSYGLAMSYLGLNDWRRALQQLRRTGIGEGYFVDKGVFRSTFALLAELEARDNDPRGALCAYDVLKRKRPDYDAGPQLASLMAAAERQLTGSDVVRSEVEIIESGRDDLIPPRWSHQVLRRALRFSGVQGALKNYEFLCPTQVTEGAVVDGLTVEPDQTIGTCTLNVYGERGAKFVLEEK